MSNSINNDEIVETDNETGNIDDTKRDFTSLKVYNAVDVSISLEKICDCL